MFAILTACSPTVTEQSVSAAIGTFERLELAEAQRGRELATASWDKWIGEAIAKGAGQAHRWANAPNAVIADVNAPGARGW